MQRPQSILISNTTESQFSRKKLGSTYLKHGFLTLSSLFLLSLWRMWHSFFHSGNNASWNGGWLVFDWQISELCTSPAFTFKVKPAQELLAGSNDAGFYWWTRYCRSLQAQRARLARDFFFSFFVFLRSRPSRPGRTCETHFDPHLVWPHTSSSEGKNEGLKVPMMLKAVDAIPSRHHSGWSPPTWWNAER